MNAFSMRRAVGKPNTVVGLVGVVASPGAIAPRNEEGLSSVILATNVLIVLLVPAFIDAPNTEVVKDFSPFGVVSKSNRESIGLVIGVEAQ